MQRDSSTIARARSLRGSMTEAERLLWGKLRDRRLGGHKFVRQMPVEPYIADFGCREAKLVVEVDGSQHAESTRDEVRDTFLVSQGFRVLRFWNPEILTDVNSVCDTIVAALDGRLEPYDRYRTKPQDPSSGPSGHLLPGGEKVCQPRRPSFR